MKERDDISRDTIAIRIETSSRNLAPLIVVTCIYHLAFLFADLIFFFFLLLLLSIDHDKSRNIFSNKITCQMTFLNIIISCQRMCSLIIIVLSITTYVYYISHIKRSSSHQ